MPLCSGLTRRSRGRARPRPCISEHGHLESNITDISVTEFKHRCLEIIRRVEESGKPVAITRRGKVVARLNPSGSSIGPSRLKPWEQLRALGGRLLAKPGESVLRDEDFEALR